MRTSAAALAPSPVSQPFESRWCWSWCCGSSAYGTNSFLGALVVSRVLGRQDRFPHCVAVPCWSRSRHGVQGRWPAADTRESARVHTHMHRDDTHDTQTQADQLTPHTPDHGGIGALARDRRVAERAAVRPGVALFTEHRPEQQRNCLGSSTQIRGGCRGYLLVRLFASARRPGRERAARARGQ